MTKAYSPVRNKKRSERERTSPQKLEGSRYIEIFRHPSSPGYKRLVAQSTITVTPPESSGSIYPVIVVDIKHLQSTCAFMNKHKIRYKVQDD